MLKKFRDRWLPENWRHELTNQVIGWSVLGALGIVVTVSWALMRGPDGAASGPQPLEKTGNATGSVAMRFVGPREPSLMLINESDVVVRDLKWAVVVWKLGQIDEIDPLPIPSASFDFIRARQLGGPLRLFHQPGIRSRLAPKDRLFGSAWVDCPECVKSRHYAVYIVWGEGGWFFETSDRPEDSRFYAIVKDVSMTKADFDKSLDEWFPIRGRMPIENR